MKKIIFLIAGIIISFSFNSVVSAATVVSSDISEDTVWTQTESPYVVQGVINLSENSQLDIQSGVVVKFASESRLVVNGELNVSGTETEKVHLTSLADDSVGGDTNGNGSGTLPTANDNWQIVFNDSKNAKMENAEIRYSFMPFFYDSSRELQINDSSVSQVQRFMQLQNGKAEIEETSISSVNDVIFLSFGKSKLNILNSNINNVGSVALVFDSSKLSMDTVIVNNMKNGAINAYASGDVDLKEVTLDGILQGSGIMLFEKSSLRLEDSIIKNVNGSALSVFEESDYRLKHSLLSGGDTGIKLFGSKKSTGDIDRVTIQNYTTAGIQSFDGGKIHIHHGNVINNKVGIMTFRENKVNLSNNTVAFNTTAGIQNFGTGAVKAQKVFWGDQSGPFHPTLNHEGTGNSVSDSVDFIPWDKTANSY